MACDRLLKSMDFSCLTVSRKWEQKIVLINRADLLRKNIESSLTKNRTEFKLSSLVSNESIRMRKGYFVIANDKANNIDGWFDMQRDSELITYRHSVTFPAVGINEDLLTFLKQIDKSDLFAVIRFWSGEIVVFGLEYGLESAPYTYKPQSMQNGEVIQLNSNNNEFDPPYIYTGDPSDFDDLFEGTESLGSFNFDFDNSFEVI